MLKIISKDNKNIKLVKSIRDKKKERRESRLFYVEGERIIKNIDFSLIDSIYVSENYNGYIPNIDEDKIYEVPIKLFDDLKDTVTTQGIIALIKMNCNAVSSGSLNQVSIILDNVQDPGNVGTILRTAEAAGVNNVVLINDSADPYSPKAIRSSMSSITRLNIIEPEDARLYVEELKNEGYKIYGTFLKDSDCFFSKEYKGKVALVFGNEANGISKEIEELCDERINIPMDGKIESLNVAQASAIVLYEIKRKKHILNE